ncbi:MAG: DUF1641 domain-containing protein [Thermoleophilia bacterium]
MEQTLLTVDQKLDLLADQVQYLTEQAQCAARRQEARAELLDDATPILNDVFRITTEQLEEVQDYVDLSDLLRLLKRLMRNTRNLDAMLDQLESLADLGRTVAPLVGDAFEKTTNLLETAEHNGYFALLRLLKDVARPETVSLARTVISQTEAEITQPIDTSLRALLRQTRDPDVRRGLGLTLRVLGVVGAQAART